jgi:2,3-bisphosphoglycerate-dependent phosphoglycerate mutase
MSATHLYLIRHGDSLTGEQDGKVTELGLSLEGIHQSDLLRDRLLRMGEIRPDVLITSTALRAQETAAIIAPALQNPLVILDPDFEEWRSDDGSLSEEEFNARWAAVPKDQKPFFRWIPGYENRLEFTLRVQLSLNRVLQTHAGKTIVVVSHGAFIQVAFGFFFGYGEANLDRAAPEIRRTSITHWYRLDDDPRWTLERSNDYAHLS